MNSAENLNDLKIQNLIKRIKELKEIVSISISTSKPKLSQEIPIGYTATRWQLALQSFNERLTVLQSKNYFNNKAEQSESAEEFLIEFGPEWELKCSENELEELLNKITSF